MTKPGAKNSDGPAAVTNDVKRAKRTTDSLDYPNGTRASNDASLDKNFQGHVQPFEDEEKHAVVNALIARGKRLAEEDGLTWDPKKLKWFFQQKEDVNIPPQESA